MSNGPQIDGRRRDDIESDVREMVPYYVEEWDPDEGDVGTGLLKLFSELAEEVTERLDRVPEKHRVSFYDTLGFSRLPPQQARLPLAVTVAPGAGENVTIRAGTQAKAEAADGSEQLFEIPAGETFDATPARIQAVYGVLPDEDAIYDHHDSVDGDSQSVLFDASAPDDLQQHALYLGDASQFAVGSGTSLVLTFDTAADPGLLGEELEWQFFGEAEVGGETVEQWHDLPVTRNRRAGGSVVLAFDPEGTLTETEVDGIESNWLRARLPADIAASDLAALFDLKFGTFGTTGQPVTVGVGARGLTPDLMLHNDVPQPQGAWDGMILPFGKRPRLQDTFYLSSTDALTKSTAWVIIIFEEPTDAPGDTTSDPPVLSWEYHDGEAWSKIDPVYDGTNNLENGGAVVFMPPDDLSKTTVAGHEGHWIRVRLVDGDYGQMEVLVTEGATESDPDEYEPTPNYKPPTFESVTLTLFDSGGTELDHALAENNLAFSDDLAAADRGGYSPFEPLPVDEQTLFLGFDAPLTDGPINLLLDLVDAAYPQDFHPQVRYEYYHTGTGEWTRPDVLDGTEGLTERGILGLGFPEETESTSLFGRDLHWVRARVTGDQFGVGAEVSDESGSNDSGEDRTRDVACGRFVETVPPAGEPEAYPPEANGLYLNAVWARNRRTVAGEVLGSSDGSIDQSFPVANRPVIEPTVWVDELAVLSEGARRTLAEQWPDRTDPETNGAGEPTAFWVEWSLEPDLLDSGPEDRHYTLDPIAGTVSFGDGTRGKIPPRGTDNVRATYTTGGGAAGNVPVGAVSGFQQSLAFVEAVTNPIAGSGGAGAEATEAVTDRAAKELRDRNRAVAPVDYERIALDVSRQLARARCLPAMNRDGDYQPGWVTVLIVPESAATKPMPSATLRQEVERGVAERAPVALVDPDVDQLVVRGPSYVSASVETDLVATGGSISELEERARGAIGSYLHPLTGGPDGDGWPFGELPCLSDLFELLEGVENVDHVAELRLTFETDRSTVTVEEGESEPETSPDALVYSGNHDVSARLAGTGGDR